MTTTTSRMMRKRERQANSDVASMGRAAAAALQATHTSATKLGRIQWKAADFVSTAKTALGEFAESFAKDPAYAFSWGNNAVQASCRRKVGEMVLDYAVRVRANKPTATDDEVADIIVTELMDECMRKARWPENSTSEISNMVAKYHTAALAEFLSSVAGK